MAPVRVRVVEYKLPAVTDGKDELYRLVTTILDPAQAPAKDLAVLYHERWDIEGFFKQIKSVQLNAEKIFRSKSPDGARQEFWAHLGVHYATMRVAVDAAHQAKLDPDRISHKDTVRIIRSRIWIPDSSPLAAHHHHYQCLLDEVALEINIERRDLSYPRVIKRKMSNVPAKRPLTDSDTATVAHPTQQSRSQHRPSLSTANDQLSGRFRKSFGGNACGQAGSLR